MKYAYSIGTLLIGLVVFSACKKEYDCHCYILDPYAGGDYIVTEYLETIEVKRKSEAIQDCIDLNKEPQDPAIHDPDGDNYRSCYLNDQQ